jgi:hypothetical protein
MKLSPYNVFDGKQQEKPYRLISYTSTVSVTDQKTTKIKQQSDDQ